MKTIFGKKNATIFHHMYRVYYIYYLYFIFINWFPQDLCT